MKIFASMLVLLLFAALAAGQSEQTMTVKVYFAHKKSEAKDDPRVDKCSLVYPVTRTIPKTAAVAKAALEQLFKGPTELRSA